MNASTLYRMTLSDGDKAMRAAFGLIQRWRILVSPCIALLMGVLIAIELGAVNRTEIVPGPFATESEITHKPTDSNMLFVRVGRDNPWRALLVARGDMLRAQQRSTLEFSVNGTKYRTAHAAQDRIRRGEFGVFAHWVKSVRFALPEGAENGPQSSVQMRYALQFRSTWTTALLLAALGALFYRLERDFVVARTIRPVLRGLAVVATGLAVGGAGLSLLYAAITLAAWGGGWALPTTAAIIGSPLGNRLAMAEPHFAEVVLWLAAAALLFGWIAKRNMIDLSAYEWRLSRMLALFGLPIYFALLLFSVSAQWSGLWRPGDISGLSIAGLLPFSDPNGYWADANDLVKDGIFSSFSARRPLAQVFRTTLATAGGFNYAAMVILQCGALAAAAFAASAAIARWLGIWPSLAFAALTYVTAREYATTALTEPIGYFWALAAIPFFADALRTRSLAHGILAITILSIALWSRMGSMFTLPALLLWAALAFGRDLFARVRSAALVGLALLAVAGLNFGAAKVYGNDIRSVGSNFSYTLCGISIGGIWGDCLGAYEKEIQRAQFDDERALNAFLYQKAFANIAADPSISARRLAGASIQFVEALPSILAQGYAAVPLVFEAGTALLILISFAGFLRANNSMERPERLFWLLFWSSVIVSAGFVFFDDGRRVMVAVYPLACLFLVRGWGGLAAQSSRSPASPILMRARYGAGLTALICLVSVFTPYFAHKFLRPPIYVERPPNSASEQFVFGGRRVTGVLVIADGEPRPRGAPAVFLSDFVRIVEQGGLESYQHLVTPAPPQTPFAFIQSPSLVLSEGTAYKFVGSPELLTRRDVKAWRLLLAPCTAAGGGQCYWLQVLQADPSGACCLAATHKHAPATN